MDTAWTLVSAQLTTVLFATFAAASVGVAAGLGLLHLKGDGRAIVRLSVASVILAVAAVICLIVRFQRIERFFNTFAHLSSPLTQSLIATFVVLAVVIVGLILMNRTDEPNKIIGAVLLLVAIAEAVFLGRFLSFTSQIASDTAVSVLLFAAVEATVAAASVWAVADGTSSRLYAIACAAGALITGVCEGILLALHAGAQNNNLGTTYLNPVTFTSGNSQVTDFMSVVTGTLAPLFWLGIVAIVVAVAAAVFGYVRATKLVGDKSEGASVPNVVAAVCASLCVLVGITAFQLVYLTAVSLTKINLFG